MKITANELHAVKMPLPWRWFERYRYALIPSECLEQVDLPTTRLTAPGFEGNEEDMPALLDMECLSAEQRVRCMEMLELSHAEGQSCPMPMLLAAPGLSPQGFARRWRLAQRMDYQSQVAWIRVFDPRVTLHLPRVMGMAFWTQLMNGCTSVAFCMGGAWWTLPVPCALQQAIGAITAKQWNALERVGAVNRALSKLGMHDAPSLLRNAEVLCDLVLRGQQRHGIQRSDDLAAYAAMGWRIHPNFDEHELVLQLLRDEDDADLTVMERLARITPDQEQQIRDELQGITQEMQT